MILPHNFKRTLLTLAAIAAVVGTTKSNAAQTKTLFVGFDNNGANVFADIIGTDSRFDLANSGYFDTQGSSPSLLQLQQYDSVLVWTDRGPSIGFGDVLADYVDSGGGVVLATFWGQHSALGPQGRINASGYNPLTTPVTSAYSPHTLGAYDASSPLMVGVSSLASTFYNADYNAGLDAGASLVASWNDGKPLAGLSGSGMVATITLSPNVAGLHHASGDYGALFRNALLYTADAQAAVPASVPELGNTGFLLLLPVIGMFAITSRRRKA